MFAQRQHQNNDKEGVRRGDTISPNLFTACLEIFFRTIDWTKNCICINGEKLNHLRFADDIIITAHAAKNNEVMLQELGTASVKCGLKMNI